MPPARPEHLLLTTASSAVTLAPKHEAAILLVLAGPTGTGKTTLCHRMVATHAGVERVVTCTTRTPRNGETDGVDYRFMQPAEFEQAVANGEFLEWARVHNSCYGTLKTSILNRLARSVDLVINIDVQGARTLRESAGNLDPLKNRLVTVFIMPQSMDDIHQRLIERGKDTPEQIERRMRTAQYEVEQWKHFDFCIWSGSREEDFLKVEAIWRAEKQRVMRLADQTGH